MATKNPVRDWISELDPAVRPIAEALQQLILNVVTDISESIK